MSLADGTCNMGDCLTISAPPQTAGTIRFTLDGTEPTEDSFLYERPPRLTAAVTVKAAIFADGSASPSKTGVYTVTPPEEQVEVCYELNGYEMGLQDLVLHNAIEKANFRSSQVFPAFDVVAGAPKDSNLAAIGTAPDVPCGRLGLSGCRVTAAPGRSGGLAIGGKDAMILREAAQVNAQTGHAPGLGGTYDLRKGAAHCPEKRKNRRDHRRYAEERRVQV